MGIAERLQMIINSHQLTNTAFADKIGVQRSSISHVLAGRNKPSLDFINKILSHFPKVDAKWLITGKQSNHVGIANKTIKNKVDQQLEFSQQKETQILKQPQKPTDKIVEKIIIFYNNGTYEELMTKSSTN